MDDRPQTVGRRRACAHRFDCVCRRPPVGGEKLHAYGTPTQHKSALDVGRKHPDKRRAEWKVVWERHANPHVLDPVRTTEIFQILQVKQRQDFGECKILASEHQSASPPRTRARAHTHTHTHTHTHNRSGNSQTRACCQDPISSARYPTRTGSRRGGRRQTHHQSSPQCSASRPSAPSSGVALAPSTLAQPVTWSPCADL
jgi:hypothetical protein